MLNLCNIKKTIIRHAMYKISTIRLSVAPVFSVSTKKLTRPVKMLAKRKNPSWLKSTADTKHTLERLTFLVVAESLCLSG